MISRYKRKPVSQHQQINQNVGKSSRNHPLPEKADVFLTPISNEQHDTASPCRSEPDLSGSSNDTQDDTKDSWSELQSCAGLSTENSSVISWGFDEFDQAATRQVQRIFKQIDELLYEKKDSALVTGLQDECKQWVSRFPHLRIQGKQMVAPSDDGYSWYSTSPCVDLGCVQLSAIKDPSELGIVGTRFPTSIPNDLKHTELPSTRCYFSLGSEEEEGADMGVIVSDGVMEEYLAFDSRDKDDEQFEWSRAFSQGSLRMGYPPISPKYSRKEAILSHLFDDVWRDLVGCLEQLIRRYWEESVSDDIRHETTIPITKVEPINPYSPLQRFPFVLPPVPNSKISPISPNMNNQSPSGTIVSPRHLNDLMVIHGIPLQQRNLPLMDRVLESGDKSPLRPTSAALISGKSRQGRSLEHSTASLSHNVPSARRRNPPRTLHPINNNPSRSATPKIEEIIRGTRMSTASDQLPGSPVPFNRNSLLPPIAASDPEHPQTSQRRTRSRCNSGRVCSATATQEKPNLPDCSSRPSTTNMLWPDTPLGRSFVTPDHIRNRRGSDGTESLSIAVTGISLGAATFSRDSSSQWGYSVNETAEKGDHSPGAPLHLLMKPRGGSLTRSKQGL
ncbi:primary cilium assembly protein FAM149B1 isoform X2 [Bombina bombina]|uniref:primary cilium assembly protein FAM149B1 isoform X2 n=1 Tax=Bombina bombina TaxID=8345 RepID=UPI00235A87AE|nr:primary cilium assembly protein FAM149B1 isoform X2 [Bombina bombina]